MSQEREIQNTLRKLGYYTGSIDGIWGNGTKSAIAEALANTPKKAVNQDLGVLKTSAQGRKLISQREGNELQAYKDSVGIWTIGVGHTSAAGSPQVTPGLKITAEQSDDILSKDLALFEQGVRDIVKVPLAQREFDALVSLAFNIGLGAFGKSTLVKKLNAVDKAGAANEFPKWNKAGGRPLAGLTKRREAERKQFLGL